MKQKLPIGLQNLREMRTQGYVDKTAYVARLAEEGKYYFLARPRRFGKSLLVDTQAEAFHVALTEPEIGNRCDQLVPRLAGAAGVPVVVWSTNTTSPFSTT